MSTETLKPRTEQENGNRMELQRELLIKCIAEGLLPEEQQMNIDDLATIKKIFKLVSDIIDNPQEEHESIRQAFELHDYGHASDMLLILVKEEIGK